MHVKIRGGTVQHGGPSLCITCRWSTVVRGAKLGQEIVNCGMMGSEDRRIVFRVTSCTSYRSMNHPTLREMEDIAWILRSDPVRNQVGFVRSSRLDDSERYVLDED